MSRASNFAPYDPLPPDQHPERLPSSSTSNSHHHPASTTSQAPLAPSQSQNSSAPYHDEYDDDPRYATESYQSGSYNSGPAGYSSSKGAGAGAGTGAGTGAGIGRVFGGSQSISSSHQQIGELPTTNPHHHHQQQIRPDHSSLVTSHSLSLSNLCFLAYALPPFSGVLVLIFETHNDLARFHGYQSSLLGVAGVLGLYVIRSWFGWSTFSVILAMAALGASWVAGSEAAKAAPVLAKVPYVGRVGEWAEEWVGAE